MEAISIYLHGKDQELKSVLEARARERNRSLSAEIVVLIKKALETAKEE